MLQTGVEKFNNAGSKDISYITYLQQAGILPAEMDSQDFSRRMALFIRYSYGINKGKIGEFIGSRKDLNKKVRISRQNYRFKFRIGFKQKSEFIRDRSLKSQKNYQIIVRDL
jgi:hypothetical protein